MSLSTKSHLPNFKGPTQAVVPTPTFSGRATDNAADSINPYTSAGPGAGGAGQSFTEIYYPDSIPSAPYSEVQALMNFNSGISDISQNAFSVTNGGVVVDSDTPFGTGQSGLFTSDTITYPVNAGLVVGAVGTDFTAEAWVKLTSLGQLARIFGDQLGTGYAGWCVRVSGGNFEFFGSSANRQVNFGIHTIGAETTNWCHIAITREGSTWRGYKDGVKGLEITQAGTPITGNIVLGGWQGSSQKLKGRMDDFRLTIGTAVYTADEFTPPSELPTS